MYKSGQNGQKAKNLGDLYRADNQKIKQISEQKVRELAYSFALTLKGEFRLSDLEGSIADLAMQVRALDLVEHAFDEMIDELEKN